MIDWIEVNDSSRVSAVAYDVDEERILVRFRKDGVEWQYPNCPLVVWQEFMAPATSKGQYIYEQLNHHDHGPLQT